MELQGTEIGYGAAGWWRGGWKASGTNPYAPTHSHPLSSYALAPPMLLRTHTTMLLRTPNMPIRTRTPYPAAYSLRHARD
eukprot:1749037-Rhodomonas_salina.1